MSIELGSVLAGIAALMTVLTGGAWWTALRARKDAHTAMQTSPASYLAGVNDWLQQVEAHHDEAKNRWRVERDGMEMSLMRQREQLEEKEDASLKWLRELAALKAELAVSRSETADLRARFEESIYSNR